MRLFIALDFEEGKDFFKEIQSKIDRNLAKMTLTKTYHLTLKFLGEVDESKVNDIVNMLNQIKFSPFSVKLNSIGVFPNVNYIRVIWSGFEKEGEIFELQQQVDNTLLDLFPKEKEFKAHITLARIRYVEDKENLKKNIENIKLEKKELFVKEFKLIKSNLTPEGPVYEEISKFGA